MERGRFIVFEGIDGAGKTTHIALLAEYLRGQGRRVAVTAEPTDGETGKMLRRALSGAIPSTPCELAALFVLDRIRHNTAPDGIEALLSAGVDVICDRYYYSTLAYQGSETDLSWVTEMNLACPAIRRPDLCVFLDLTPEESLVRIAARGEAREIYETREKLAAVRSKFLQVFDLLQARDRIAIVSAAGSIPETQALIREAIGG
ncbi:MAG TPA: dTMP kinase [Clostridiales bacterium]|nr:dTMP kinase [Clostridiales bacterium]